MPPSARSVQRTYLALMLGNTLAASLIWGINTIFLLDAGLSNLEAFAANAFFTAGMLLFEVPTGIVADTVGRRASYLLGTVTLMASTLLYVLLWQTRSAVLVMGGRVDAPRPRLHVLLRRGRGLAGRRPHGHGLRRVARVGVRARPDGERGGDAHRLDRRRLPRRAGQPRHAVRGAWRDPGGDVRDRLPGDARHRVHAGEGRTAARRDAQDRRCLDRLRLARARRQVADAPGAVHRRRRDLRLLRAPALPARALRRPRGVPDRRPRGRDRGGRPDPRRRPRAAHPAGCSAAARRP